MDPIGRGQSGAAVEDVQQRLEKLGYNLGPMGIDALFGPHTQEAVLAFRNDVGLPALPLVDAACWSALVDETYELGDRSLYLMLPNFHGRDVRELQQVLNTLGFSCGKTDGVFGVHTEAALRQFQANMGLMGDGIAFQETFDAIARLRHVLDQKQGVAHSAARRGLARTAQMLEDLHIALTATDPIARSIISRVWNVASATTEESGICLVDSIANCPNHLRFVLSFTAEPITENQTGVAQYVDAPVVVAQDFPTFATRLKAAVQVSSSQGCTPPCVIVQVPNVNHYDGTFTNRDAQSIALSVVDALCEESY